MRGWESEKEREWEREGEGEGERGNGGLEPSYMRVNEREVEEARKSLPAQVHCTVRGQVRHRERDTHYFGRGLVAHERARRDRE